MSRGVLIFAHNNKEIDYIKISYANALMIKKNLKVPVTLVTDSGTLNWANNTIGKESLNNAFEKIIEIKKDQSFENPRNYQDTTSATKLLQFYNCNHWQAYDLSPYEETLFIDADYLIMSSALNNCWGSESDVMVSSKIYSPNNIKDPYFKYVDEMGIKLFWATVIYFKKSKLAEYLFSIARHVQENYLYYKDLYFFENSMFRNDNTFSIAIHMLNGYSHFTTAVQELPIPGLLMSWDTNDIYKINGLNDITLYAEKDEQKESYILTRIKGTDVHIMNKWAINRHVDNLISLYKENNV